MRLANSSEADRRNQQSLVLLPTVYPILSLVLPRAISSARSPQVSGFDTSRGGLYFKNNGHTVQVDVCGFNAADCTARANFGMWPRTMRGIDVSGMGTWYVV